MASQGSDGDSDSYSDGPETGFRDAFVSEVFVSDANQGEGGRPTPTAATTTPGAPTEGTARGERGADAPLGDASQPDLTTPEGRGAVRDVLGRAMASTSYTGGGQGQGPHGHSGDAQAPGAGHQGGTPPGQQGVPVPDPQSSPSSGPPAQGYGEGPHLQGQGGGLPGQGQGGDPNSGGGQPAPSLGPHQQVSPRQTGEQVWRAYWEQSRLASQAPTVSSGVQVKTELLQPQGQPSLATGQGQGQPTQGGHGQQGLGGYGPQLSDPYQGQSYGLSSQSTQQANPFAAGATSTPAPSTLYNTPYGSTVYGVTTSAAPSVKMPQTAIASYGGISVANMQRAGFGFANPFSQPAGQAPPVLHAPQQTQQLTWTGPNQPPQQPQAWQGQGGTNVNSPSSVKVEPPQSSRSSAAGQQSFGGVPSYGSNGNPYANPSERQPVFGMPSSIKNAVRMIQPFYSDGATIEKARAFWDSFEMATVGLSDTIRLSAFRECLKGKPGEDWWMYSQITDFETLRRRFHNQFICQTPLQMIERLKSTKRTKGMSAEVWGDLISSLCDAAHCYDAQMRYQYFLSGLRNREWKTALTTSMVNTIPEAVFVLLYKNMHLPVEDDAEFEDDGGKKPATESAMMQQMLNMMQQTQNLLAQQQQMVQAPRSPRRAPMVAAAYENAMGSPRAADTTSGPENSGAYSGGIRQGPDRFTQDGLRVCGRCHLMGCSRITCRYGNMTCGNCRVRGHVTSECERPRQQGAGGMNRSQPQGAGGPNRGQQQNAGSGNGYSPRNPRACYMCKATDHGVSDCPLMSMLRNMAGQNATGTTPIQGQVPSQQ